MAFTLSTLHYYTARTLNTKEDEQRLQMKVRESQEKCQSQYVHQRSTEQSAEVGKKTWQIYLHARMAPTRPLGKKKVVKNASRRHWRSGLTAPFVFCRRL